MGQRNGGRGGVQRKERGEKKVRRRGEIGSDEEDVADKEIDTKKLSSQNVGDEEKDFWR
jgi:hypothetical protein